MTGYSPLPSRSSPAGTGPGSWGQFSHLSIPGNLLAFRHRQISLAMSLSLTASPQDCASMRLFHFSSRFDQRSLGYSEEGEEKGWIPGLRLHGRWPAQAAECKDGIRHTQPRSAQEGG